MNRQFQTASIVPRNKSIKVVSAMMMKKKKETNFVSEAAAFFVIGKQVGTECRLHKAGIWN